MRQLPELANLIARHTGNGPCRTAIPNLDLYRADRTTTPMQAINEGGWRVPAFCVIAQGRKRALIGSREVIYDAQSYLILAVDLPILGSIFEATDGEPFLGIRLKLDAGLLNALLMEMPFELDDAGPAGAIEMSILPPDLLDSVVRLMCLLDDPHDIAMLARQVEREICYRLFRGPQRGLLRQIANADSHFSQIKRAAEWMRVHYAERLPVERVAAIARMSPSSFHQHFKAVTSMSPLQFQKQIRLLEARRLICSRRLDAASASFRVGYESPSHFNRDYKRLFGEPPARNAARLAGVLEL